MINIVEFLVNKNKKSKSVIEISKNDFEDILKEGEYIIYVDLYDISRDYYELEKTYIIKVGDNTIGAEFGQNEFDEDVLDDQNLAGQWALKESKYTPLNNVLRYLSKKIKDDNCCKHFFNNGDCKKCYKVDFVKTNYVLSDMYEKIYDARQ